jgi:hypothetical protein
MAVEKVEKYLDQLVAEMEKPLRDATPMDKEAILNHFEKMGELPADLREALKRAESLCSDISQRGQQLKKVCLATLGAFCLVAIKDHRSRTVTLRSSS